MATERNPVFSELHGYFVKDAYAREVLEEELTPALVRYEEQGIKPIDISVDYLEHSVVYITKFRPSRAVFENTNGDNTIAPTADKNLLDFAKLRNYPIMVNAIWHKGYHINNGVVEYEGTTDPSGFISYDFYSGFNGNFDIVFYDAFNNPNYTEEDLLAIGNTWGLTFPPVVVNGAAFDLSSWTEANCQNNETLYNNMVKLRTEKAARQVIAEKGTGELYIFTFTGKSNGFMQGVNYEEMAAYLLSKGMRNAMNLDGGGSTQTVINKFAITPTQDRSSVNGRLIPVALCFEV